MVSSTSLSLLLIVSLAAAISVVDAASYGALAMNKNLRGVYSYQRTTSQDGVTVPAPAPSIRILQGDEQSDFPTLSPIIVEYWDITGYGIGYDTPDAIDDVPDVVQDQPLSEENIINVNGDENENTKSKNRSNDDKWIIVVAAFGSAAFLLMIAMWLCVCCTRRRAHVTKQAAGENPTAATAAAAAGTACVDPTETDRDFSEHPDIREITTDSSSV
jgi:hypothetical protein